MSIVGSTVDRVIPESESSILPEIKRLLRLHASASLNWRILLDIEEAFVSGHLSQGDSKDEPDDLSYNSLDDLQWYEYRAKGELQLGDIENAAIEFRRIADRASKLPDIEWNKVRELYQQAIDTAKAAESEENIVKTRISLTIAALNNEVSKSEINSLWDAAVNSWQNLGAKPIIYPEELAKEAVESQDIEWQRVKNLYQKMISLCEEKEDYNQLSKLYWQFAELSHSSGQAPTNTISERYSKAIRAFKHSVDTPSYRYDIEPDTEDSVLARTWLDSVIRTEERLSLNREETILLYQGAIRRTQSNPPIFFRENTDGEGFTAVYIPLRGISDNDLVDDVNSDIILKFLNSCPEWGRRKTAQDHLVELRDAARVQIEDKYCPNGTKKELLQLLAGECGTGVFSGGFRPKELAELVGCSESYAKNITFRNPSEEVRGSEREAVLENDDGLRKKNRCAACGGTCDLQVHHIIPMSSGGSKDMANLATLCRSCHREAHSGTWGPIIYDTVDEFWSWVESHPSQ